MHEYLHVLVESLLDTVKILPILFVVYYLIELLEYKEAKKIANHKLFKGKASPVMGAVIGSVPQCGFSVVSTDLFSKKHPRRYSFSSNSFCVFTQLLPESPF